MDRDCGKGKLIPTRYEVKWAIGKSDKSKERTFSSLVEAQNFFTKIVRELVPCSNAILYAKDKEGYANRLQYVFYTYDDGMHVSPDRSNEL